MTLNFFYWLPFVFFGSVFMIKFSSKLFDNKIKNKKNNLNLNK